MQATAESDLHTLLANARAAHQRQIPDYRQRMDDLAKLRRAYKSRLEEFASAVSTDFGHRSRHESLLSDGMTVLKDIDYIRDHLRIWMRAKSGCADWLFFPARTQVRYQPVGVVGIISPWNYPMSLALRPLIAAIAAGNHVLLKPSEHTPRTSVLLHELLAGVFPKERVATVIGQADVAAAFAALSFDHLFFTGSSEVGRRVMAAAASNLTPVTLELGGKSPAIIAPGCHMPTVVDRIAAGKFLNAGQTCIAPDYVLLQPNAIPGFVKEMRNYVDRRYANLVGNPDYCSIINAHQYQRLTGYLDEARNKGAQIIELAQGDPPNRVLAPTLVLNAGDDLRLMQEEIFGPILPLVAVDSVDAAIEYINARPKPLALYHFDHNRLRIEQVLNQTTAGGVCINDTVMHFAQSGLPFGGVGASGMGQYHGHAGFLAFSKQKPVLYQARWTTMKLLRPPYGRIADLLVRLLTR